MTTNFKQPICKRCIIINEIVMARGITNETKAKFEALLKAALKKTDSKSTQNLIEHDQEKGEDNKAIDETLQYEEQINPRSFILDKFLSEEISEDVQKPIPKVRKKLLKQKSNDSEKESVQSNQTFTVEKDDEIYKIDEDLKKSAVIRKFSSSSQSSRRTYDINKEEIGDILVHDRKEAIQILKVNTNKTASSISNTEYEGIELNELQNKEIYSEVEKSDGDDEKTNIRYENEIKKKKSKKKSKENLDQIDQIEQIQDKSSNTIISVTIHKTDRLKLNKFIIQPVVKIYIINYENGEYIKNNLSPGIENNENITMTQQFNLQKERKFYPEWEETLIINIDYNKIIEENNKAMFLFEIIDFENFYKESSQLNYNFNSTNWSNIAWAFLKIVAGDGSHNTNKQLRLQLYKPGQSKKGSFCPVYDWWKQRRIKYPSTLYVTVKGVISPNIVAQNFKNKNVELPPKEDLHLNNEDVNKGQSELKEDEKEKVNEILAHLEEKTFKLPNKLRSEIDSGNEGCFTLKISNTGKYLICAILSKEVYSLVVHFLPDLEEFFKLSPHQDLIYNITFSKNDDLVLASSADGTVSIWDLNKVKFIQMLPHPSFVYWCEIGQDFIVTGCYDKTIRIWRLISHLTWELFQELEGHNGYITCLCISMKSNYIYSSDSSGAILCWERNNENWNLYKEIILVELNKTVINQILLHKRGKRLIIHARDSIVRVLDIKNGCIIHWLEGGENNRVRTLCCFSHCNSYIFCGTESGNINVWNIETGKLSAIYHPYKKLSINNLPIHSLDFCPKYKMLAFAHFGHKIPITVYSYDPITTDVDLESFDIQRKWKNVISSAGQKTRVRSAEISCGEDKSVNLKGILDKIDKIIN